MAKPPPYQTPPEQIPVRLKEAASKSGRPLEVVCARSFLEAPMIPACMDPKEAWKVHLSSYYYDHLSEKIRELDVLARRQKFTALNPGGFNSLLEAFISCKGFPEDSYPISFATTQPVDLQPQDPPTFPVDLTMPRTPRLMKEISVATVDALLFFLCGMNSGKRYSIKRTIGFDIVEDPHEAGKSWETKGDRTLFESLDGALRASFYWRNIPISPVYEVGEGLIRIQIPVMVLLRPWHEISIDGGTLGDPVEMSLGYIANLYPGNGGKGPPTSLCTILLSRDRLPDLQKALVNLYGKMWDWGREAYRNPR